MKQLFIALGNLVLLFWSIIVYFVGILWTGKLPKVSVYHMWKYEFSFKETFYDTEIQTKQSKLINKTVINDLLREVILSNPDLTEFKLPIRDKKGEIYGEQGVCGYVINELGKKLDERYNNFNQ